MRYSIKSDRTLQRGGAKTDFYLAFSAKKSMILRLFVYIYREKSKHSHTFEVGFLFVLNI